MHPTSALPPYGYSGSPFDPFCRFLRALYHQAVAVQRDFNLLVHKIAGDEDFLKQTLAKTIEGIISM